MARKVLYRGCNTTPGTTDRTGSYKSRYVLERCISHLGDIVSGLSVRLPANSPTWVVVLVIAAMLAVAMMLASVRVVRCLIPQDSADRLVWWRERRTVRANRRPNRHWQTPLLLIGSLQLHELTDPPVTYLCPRCGWNGYVWKVATVGGDWAAAAPERCDEDLHPGIPDTVSYWSVSWPTYASKTSEERMPFTVIRSRNADGHLGSRDEMYQPHLSQCSEVWEFTSALIKERRDGSMYDLAEISQAEAHAIMERTRASYLRPGAR
jgi:hypothetical protein